MKFLLFADLHHYPGVFMSGSWEDLRLLQRRAEEENCEFMIHAGDFCHGPSKFLEYVGAYNDFHIPSYHALGNHDTDNTDYKEVLRLYNMPNGYYFFDRSGYRTIITDTNYYCVNGEYIHYNLGNYYANQAYRDYVPPEQLEWLKKTIEESPYPCILISYSSFERKADGVKNQEDVRRIINEANQRKKHSVIMCINGHHHRDYLRILDNVCYLDMNSVRYDWLPIKHNLFPEELCQKYRCMRNVFIYNDPLYAVVTVGAAASPSKVWKAPCLWALTASIPIILCAIRAAERLCREFSRRRLRWDKLKSEKMHYAPCVGFGAGGVVCCMVEIKFRQIGSGQ